MARDKALLENRNIKIYKKYRELYESKRLRRDDVIQELSSEFDLAKATVSRIVSEMHVPTNKAI